jgi:acetylornithine/N-succinyldiaminopimelate aminotransferase
MLDEVQTGVGRTGTFLACEAFGVKPDIVTLAKGLCGGVPAGAVLAGEKTQDIFQIGDHGSTFGGNLLAAAAGLVVLETVNNPAFLKEISRKGDKIVNTLKSWNHPKITEVRGRGLMVGIDITEEAWPLLEKGVTRTQAGSTGLLLLSAGKQTLRMLPPYIISDAEIEEGLEILKAML